MMLLLSSSYSFSQWNADPAVNTTVAEGANRYSRPATVADNVGGIVTVFGEDVYNQATNSETRTFFVQILSTSGVAKFSGVGKRISASANNMLDHRVVADGSGGVVVLWLEEEVYGSDQAKIFAQRIDNAGNLLWGATGQIINATVAEYELGQVIRDVAGNYVFSYGDDLTNKNFAQKISSNGVIQWGAGVQLVDPLTSGNHGEALAYLEGSGYKFIWQETYTDGINKGARYFWQKINADGTKNGPNFLIDNYVPNPLIEHGIEALASDENGGYYFFTIGNNNVVAQLYLQHVLSDGTKAYNQTPWGMEIDNSIGKFYTEAGVIKLDKGVAALEDGFGGAVVVWTDTRGGIDGAYAQRFSSTGTKMWGASDLNIASGFTLGDFYGDHLKRNNDGDFIFWLNKKVSSSSHHIYAQKISAAGIIQYPSPGILVSNRDSRKFGDMVVVSDKVVFVWEDHATGGGNSKIFAQSVYSNGALPVKFAAFSAMYQNGFTKLSWSTATETNNDYFDIERSEDGLNFTAIGKVAGATNSNRITKYTYLDKSGIERTALLYYRIKQVDKDGSFDYTEIKVVKVPNLNVFAVHAYPNPVVRNLTVSLGEGYKSATYVLTDMSGKSLLKGNLISSHQIDVSNLPKGAYILKLKAGDENFSKKIIKL